MTHRATASAKLGTQSSSTHQSLTVRAAARSVSAAVRCLQKRVNAPLSEEELKIELKIYYGQRGG